MAQNIFDEFNYTAYRIEALPNYAVDFEDEAFGKFLNGNPVTENVNADWLTLLRKWTSEGKTIERIRVVSEELTPYEKFEFDCYHKNWLSGERIYVLMRSDYDSLFNEEMAGDVWIFDESFAAKLNYDSDGHFINFDVIRDSDVIDKYVLLFYKAKSLCFGDYTRVTKQINNSPVFIKKEL